MIWFQGAVSFLVWIAYGVFQSRRSESLRVWVSGLDRTHRVISGAGLMLFAASVLVGGLALVMSSGGFTAAGMTFPAWIAVTLLGWLFVASQTLATALLVSLIQPRVTNEPGAASLNRVTKDPQP